MVPPELKSKAVELARQQDISLGEFIRRALQAAIKRNGGGGKAHDPLLNDRALFRGKTPRDLSRHHDSYL